MYLRKIIDLLSGFMSDTDLIRWLTSPLPSTGRTPQDHIILGDGESALAAAKYIAYMDGRVRSNGHAVA